MWVRGRQDGGMPRHVGACGTTSATARRMLVVRIRFTVIDPSESGAAVDVVVCAAVGTLLGQLRGELLSAVGRTASDAASLYAGAGVLSDDALLGRAPLIEGAVLTVGIAGTVTRPQGLLELHVVGGAGAGSVHRLLPGEHTVGRAREATVRLDDPAASRLHAVLTVTPDRVTIRDLGSTERHRH